LEIGAAPTIHPYALWVIPPRLAVVACGTAALDASCTRACRLDTRCVGRYRRPAHAVLSAPPESKLPTRSRRGVIHPNAPVAVAPRLVKNAGASLRWVDKLNASADIAAQNFLFMSSEEQEMIAPAGKRGRRRVCRLTNSQRNREQRNKANTFEFHQSLLLLKLKVPTKDALSNRIP
jgi:hypothetical protein